MKRFAKSIRKYIRREKARIRREILDIAGQNRQIADLLERLKSAYNKSTAQKIDKKLTRRKSNRTRK